MASHRPPSASSARPTAPRRTTLDRDRQSKFTVESRESNVVYECKAAYLVIFDDIEDEIKSQKELSKGSIESIIHTGVYTIWHTGPFFKALNMMTH